VGNGDGDLDVVDLDRRAVQLSLDLVRQVSPADLSRPTPCSGWTLRDLLEHMTARHYVFAAASRGQGADPRSWLRPTRQDHAEAYADAAAYVLEAFAAPGALERELVLSEISTGQFQAVQAIGFHLLDCLVHSWDVARSLGLKIKVADDLADAGLMVALRVPDGPRRLAPGAAFRPSIPAAPEAIAMERALAALGRSPAWPD
jgi:uncharacterized protein (TIGR03086 family)